MNKNPELLAPAGNFEKLKIALAYGADAVYMAGKEFGLRAFAGNFDNDEIEDAVQYTHKRDKKLYITMNIFAHNDDFKGMQAYMEFLNEIGIDGVILSDPGIFYLAKKHMPKVPIHLSTQANNTNSYSAKYWYDQGIKRIILARELSLGEIREIRDNTDENLELESFVHGAMCISYSGRCLLSSVLTGRDANRGECSHPCRWKYSISEEKRPGEYFPVEEDIRGSYIMNSKDLSMVEYIPQLIESGLDSFKIEGRMKSSYYVATIVRAYRRAIDSFLHPDNEYTNYINPNDEVYKVSHRPYTTGFYFHRAGFDDQHYDDVHYIRGFDFVGMVLDYDRNRGYMAVEQRNLIEKGDLLEIMTPKGENIRYPVDVLLDEEKQPISRAPHPQQMLYLPIDREIEEYSILRRPKY